MLIGFSGMSSKETPAYEWATGGPLW